MGSLSCALTSSRSFSVGLRARAAAAKSIGSKGTSFISPFAFVDAFMRHENGRTTRKTQSAGETIERRLPPRNFQASPCAAKREMSRRDNRKLAGGANHRFFASKGASPGRGGGNRTTPFHRPCRSWRILHPRPVVGHHRLISMTPPASALQYGSTRFE
jgi:hypothetical protein